MLPRFLTVVVVAVVLSVFAAGAAFAAPNPSGQGQPNQSCEKQPSGPAGFQSGGFATAESNYAGSGAGSVNHAGSDSAVSQYDVACYQVSQ
jgi:hypothetical protein